MNTAIKTVVTTPARARAYRKSDPEYARVKAESDAEFAAYGRALTLFQTEVAKTYELIDAKRLTPELRTLIESMQKQGPAVALAVFAACFPHIDMVASFNDLHAGK